MLLDAVELGTLPRDALGRVAVELLPVGRGRRAISLLFPHAAGEEGDSVMDALLLFRVGEEALEVLDVLGRHGRQLGVELALRLELGAERGMACLEIGNNARDLDLGDGGAVLRGTLPSQRESSRGGGRGKRARRHTSCKPRRFCSMTPMISP